MIFYGVGALGVTYCMSKMYKDKSLTLFLLFMSVVFSPIFVFLGITAEGALVSSHLEKLQVESKIEEDKLKRCVSCLHNGKGFMCSNVTNILER